MQPIRFGKFWLVEKIATGGMAEIFKAIGVTSTGKKQVLAIKRILPQFTHDQEFINLLIDEAKIMVLLNHPNIVPMVEFGKVENIYFIAMEYVEGTTLKDLFKKVYGKGDKFSIDLAVHIIRDIGTGLAYAHRKTDENQNPIGIVHRDISPANIFLSFDGEVKIGDFGISKADIQSHRTQVGIIRGKTGYMSPEQTLSGNIVDLRSDLYSLGIILYELLSGKRLYKAKSIPEGLRKVRKGEVPPLSAERSGIPNELEEVTLKALAVDPEIRYQRVDDFVDALNEFLTRWKPKGRRVRVTHNDLVGFLKRYFEADIGKEKEASEKFQNIDVTQLKPFAADPTKDGTTKSQGEAKLDVIAANPQYEFSEPEHSLLSEPSGPRPSSEPTVLAGEGESVSFKDRPSSSIQTIKSFSILLLTGILGGMLVIGLGLHFYRNWFFLEDDTSLNATPIPTATSPRALKTPISTPKPTETPKPLKTMIKVVTNPRKAEIFINGNKVADQTPFHFEVLVNEKYKLVVKKKGYRSDKREIIPVNTQGIKFTIDLKRIFRVRRTPKPPIVSTPAPLGSSTIRPKSGYLKIQADTWAEVFIDGKRLGPTPIFPAAKVSAGRHKLKFVNSFKNLTLEKTVRVGSGKKIFCKVNLEKKKVYCEPYTD